MKPLKFEHFYGTYESRTRTAAKCCEFVNENKVDVVSISHCDYDVFLYYREK